jgi:hypothetical protein
MDIDLTFAPDPERAAALNRRMHLSLADSLQYVTAQAKGACAFDEPALSTLVARLRAGELFGADTFAAYYTLVPALADGDEAAASAAFATLAAARPIAPGLRVLALSPEDLGGRFETYFRLMEGEGSMPLGMRTPSPEVAQRFRERFARGLALLDAAVPEVAGEVRHIINELLIVTGDPTLKYQFDGGSHFQLWGALFLNADFHQTDYAMAEVIAHESAHSLLFSFCIDEALVENEDDELFTSPLRPDPRPMDGIYHATFVSARMHWTMTRLLDSGLLDASVIDAVQQARDADARNFEAGYGVIAAHGRLTVTGRALMESARAYMSDAMAAAA